MRGPNPRRVDSRGRRRRPSGHVRFATIRSFSTAKRRRNTGATSEVFRYVRAVLPLAPWTLDQSPHASPSHPFYSYLFLFFFFFLHFTALFILPVRGRNEVDEVSLTFSFACEWSAVLDGNAG